MLARIGILLALATVALVPAAQSAVPSGPTGLRAFLLRADEPALDTFPRTPSFEWAPYLRATSYDFELATSKTFDDRAVVWSTNSRKTPLRVPAVAIPTALPWMTGNPYALYAHVRAHVGSRVTRWSTPFGFNMRWKAEPEQILPDTPGLVRWTPVEGATSYEVWFIDPGKVVSTSTNVADEREYYSFHSDPLWSGTVQWRVRAVRTLYGSLPTGLPVVTYGPWSQTFVSSNPPVTTGPISLLETASDVVGSQANAGGAQPDAFLRLQRRHRHERVSGTPVPRLRRHRPPVRERRVHRRGRRQPRVRAAHQRAARPPDLDRSSHQGTELLPRRRRAGGHLLRRLPRGDDGRELRRRVERRRQRPRLPEAPRARRRPHSQPTSPPPAPWSTSGTAAGRPAATTGRSSRCARS